MNLIGNLNLSNVSDGQVIYTSQLYGTFFSVFAIADATDKGKYYDLSSIKLKLMNYKGVINLGITKAELITNRKKSYLNIEVQALADNNKDFPVEIKGKKHLVKGSDLQVSRYVKPINKPSATEVKKEPAKGQVKDGIFDEEYYYREGVLYPNDIARKKHAPIQWEEEFSEEAAKLQGNDAGGWICPFFWLIIL